MSDRFIYLDRGQGKRTAADFQHFKAHVCKGLGLYDCVFTRDSKEMRKVESADDLADCSLKQLSIVLIQPFRLQEVEDEGNPYSEQEIQSLVAKFGHQSSKRDMHH